VFLAGGLRRDIAQQLCEIRACELAAGLKPGGDFGQGGAMGLEQLLSLAAPLLQTCVNPRLHMGGERCAIVSGGALPDEAIAKAVAELCLHGVACGLGQITGGRRSARAM